ncbi:putative monocarboxylate transporter 12 [Apostichopus japonicus]|uniref:Putative monocarboxylate transporter 12 n=1 Tax=Stichopus japonicus TaxID=307972 RepID=A0A2G8KN39_STIJA|nr:putative monocarboxylate transporter 12 [Apostichopus japonicus]
MSVRDSVRLVNRGWIVSAASFLVFGGVLSPMTVYGRLFVDIETELGTTAVQTGWIASMTWGMCFFGSPISERLEKYISYRPLTVIGSSLTALTIFLSSFMDSFLGLLVLYGIGYGTASNFVIHSVMCVIFEHLPHRHRILASGIAFSGSSLATIGLVVAYEKLLPVIGWRIVLRLTSLFTALVAVPASFLISEPPHRRRTSILNKLRSDKKTPPNNTKSNSSHATVDKHQNEDSQTHEADYGLKTETWTTLLKAPVTWLFFFAIFLPTMTWSVYWINIVSYFDSIHVTEACLNNLLTVQPIFELIGKIGIGIIAESVPHCTLLICHNLLFFVTTLLITFVPVYKVLLLCSILIGTGRGIYNVLPYSVSTQILPDHVNDKAITLTMIAYGFGFTFGTLPAGAIYDVTGSYTYAFVLNAGLYDHGVP